LLLLVLLATLDLVKFSLESLDFAIEFLTYDLILLARLLKGFR